MARMKTIKAVQNIWGNWGCFIGSVREDRYGERYDAVDWLSEKMKEGSYIISDKSDLKQADIDAHRAKLGE